MHVQLGMVGALGVVHDAPEQNEHERDGLEEADTMHARAEAHNKRLVFRALNVKRAHRTDGDEEGDQRGERCVIGI